MTAILAGAGRIAGARHGISGKIISGVQAAGARLTGQDPVRSAAPGSLVAGLSDGH
jgi:hypothetical protein